MKNPKVNGVQPLGAEELIEKQRRMSKDLLLEHAIELPKTLAATTPAMLEEAPAEPQSRSIYEESIANTLANMHFLIFYLETLTPAYNPIAPEISIAALTAACAEAEALVDASVEKAMEQQQASNARKVNFGIAQKRATGVINQLEVSGAPRKTVVDAKHWLKKFRGERIGTPDPNNPGNTISASQKSFVDQEKHFRNFLNVVFSFAGYDSNVDALKPVALNALCDELDVDNLAKQQTTAVAKTSRIVRNQFFNEVGGFCDRGMLAKKTVKATYGSTSPEYLAISHLKFNKIRG